MIRVLFFGRLRDELGLSEIDWHSVSTIGVLRQELASTLQPGGNVLLDTTVKAAVNQLLAPDSHMLLDGDELAFLPPVSGG